MQGSARGHPSPAYSAEAPVPRTTEPAGRQASAKEGGKGLIVGVDIGGTKTQVAYPAGGGLVTCSRFPTPREPRSSMEEIVRAIRSAPLPAPLAGVGVGCPGPLDQEAGTVHSPPNLPLWDDFPITRSLEDRLGVEVLLENDANAGALGEATHGSGRGSRTLFYVTVSTGIGAGVVIDRRIHRGANGLAGEVWAFVPASFGGMDGSPNVTETASGAGMVRRVRELVEKGEKTSLAGGELDAGRVIAAMLEGDPVAVRVVERAHICLAGVVAFAIHLLAPDLVVLAGGLSRDESWFVEPVRERVRRMTAVRRLAETPIRRADLWEDAVLYGAVELFAE
jgi:glucokinase